MPSRVALGSIEVWVVLEDRADVDGALRQGMLEQNIGEMQRGAESQNEEGKERVDGKGGSSPSVTREQMFHHLGIVEEFVPGYDDRYVLAHMYKIPERYSTGP